MGDLAPAVDRGHAVETIAAVIGDLELTRIAIGTDLEDSRVAAAAKLKALAGELADLAAILHS